ncbi:MAG: universal stress protein [Verrucomicrobia subdivision 3 bacterium]|nr:universal stress protein [Limisphaerales bacterium]
MSFEPLPDALKIESIFHPTDFSKASEVAFHHALKTALVTRAKFSILHVSAGANSEWQDFPAVRDSLERWGLIPKDSPKRAVTELGLDVRKVEAYGRDPVKACLGFLEKHPADLIVLAVHRRAGKTRWLGDSVGEPIARHAGQMTLFVPSGVSGFVSQDGTVALRRILVPIAAKPRPQPAIEAVRRIISALHLPDGEVTLLHVGSADDAPAVTFPDVGGWTWQHTTRQGDVTESILDAASAIPADLVVMTTEGRHGFLDALRGSTSEQVLRRIKCPLLSLPAGSLLG